MAILARGGATYARLRFNTGPGGQLLLRTEVDYHREFPAADHAAWQAEYDRCVVDERTLRLESPAASADLRRSQPVELLAAALAPEYPPLQPNPKEVLHRH